MKTTTSLHRITNHLFPALALAILALTGCAAATDGSEPVDSTSAELGGTAGDTPETDQRRALMRAADGERHDIAVSHVPSHGPVPVIGGPPPEGPMPTPAPPPPEQ